MEEIKKERRRIDNLYNKEYLADLEAFREKIRNSICKACNTASCACYSCRNCKACSGDKAIQEAKDLRECLLTITVERNCSKVNLVNVKEKILRSKYTGKPDDIGHLAVYNNELRALERKRKELEEKVELVEKVTSEERKSLLPWEELWHNTRENFMKKFLLECRSRGSSGSIGTAIFPRHPFYKNDKYCHGVKTLVGPNAPKDAIVKVPYLIIVNHSGITSVASIVERDGVLLEETFTCKYVRIQLRDFGTFILENCSSIVDNLVKMTLVD